MKTIKINYGIDSPTYVTVTEAEVRRAFTSEDKFKKFIKQIKEAGAETHARPLSFEDKIKNAKPSDLFDNIPKRKQRLIIQKNKRRLKRLKRRIK